YGGFWIRVAATIIDTIVVSIAQYAIYIPVIILVSRQANLEENPWSIFAAQMLLALFSMVLTAAYEIWMVGRYGATLGKMACRLRVVTAEGGRVSYARSTGRHFAKYISYFTLYIGFIIAGFDREKRTLHDLICNTRIVKI
ncbi:MAG: RDD family protein, partial [Verrucomicrobia bacterium]|nr:RDD family protein [Verrucomicrobiota bacterium]